MPTYAYACTACDHRFETQQAFTDAALTECPQCEGRLRKLFNSVGIVFKGSGFYRTDSRTNGSSKVAEASSNGSKDGAGASSDGTSNGAGSSSSASGSSASGSAGSGSSGSGGASGSSSTSAASSAA